MMRFRSLSVGLTLAVAAAIVGCGETTPAGPTMDGPLFGHAPPHAGGHGNGLQVLRNDSPREQAHSVTRTIGASGGTLTVAGVTLSIPEGALESNVEITMTVPKGAYFEAQFEPHGLQFDEPALLTMRTNGTLAQQANEQAIEVTGKVQNDVQQGLQGVYFEGTLGVDAEAKEIVNATQTDDDMSMWIKHFSGYCFAVG